MPGICLLPEIEADAEAQRTWITIEYDLAVSGRHDLSSLVKNVTEIDQGFPSAAGPQKIRKRESLADFQVRRLGPYVHPIGKPVDRGQGIPRIPTHCCQQISLGGRDFRIEASC